MCDLQRCSEANHSLEKREVPVRAPAKLRLAIAIVVVASCSGGDRDEKAPPRDLSRSRALTPAEDRRVAVSPLEAGQTGKTTNATSAPRAMAQAAPRSNAPPAAETISVAAAPVGSTMTAATQEPVVNPQMSEMQNARMDPAAASAPEPAAGVSGPAARPAGDEAMGDGNGATVPHIGGGIIMIRGGAGGIDDDCDELATPQRPNQPVAINTRAPNMGGSLSNPNGATAAVPRAANPTAIRGGSIRGGGGVRGGGSMRGGGSHH